ncbi:ATP-binding protein [Actinoplanes italicus]|uniref:Tetratricopeptide repeat protein n=1 Tax=Actinoplanes italicus TaxID=113567 RepID=A0A2T0K903_9ACTN|nr:FxSxx-COOH system tetratricopeptide repeat protein [Actinoplanes italicus]PRX19266.1 tetratricopeptide repeat protein [Actinoplanes italicus]GIE30719.1 ATP-binding protein [Actinoplanes italicus]
MDGVPDRIFISHTGRDRAWAEWARWHLESAGYPTELDTVDWAPGTNVVEALHRALHRDNPLLVLLSTAYLGMDRFTMDEWTARFAQRRRDPKAKLIPLRLDDVDLSDGLWAPIFVPSLFDLPPDQAVALLLEAVRQVAAPGGVRSAVPPTFPGRVAASIDGPRPPGSLPSVWNLARRNPDFTGRDDMLNRLHDTLSTGHRVAVQALHGSGGVGKTQLALEYAHRFAGEYDLVWWVPSEKPELIGEHLAALAQDLDLCLVPVGTSTPESVRALHSHLRRTGRWLLIFDNAEDRDRLAPWLPDGSGHLLITSRSPAWAGIASVVDVDVFTRAESLALLGTSLPHLGESDADGLAHALGDLPLAVAQAMGLLAETRMSVSDYLTDLAVHAAELMDEGDPPAGYPLSLAATVTLTADRLSSTHPAAGQVLYLCARLGPEPIPADLFTARPDLLPTPLKTVAGKPVAFRRTMAQLARHGLARVSDSGPTLHRLVQAVLRDTDPDQARHQVIVENLLAAAKPDDGTHPQWWPRWSELLPHILAADPGATGNADLRATTCSAVWHLMARGDLSTALPLAEHLYRAWSLHHGRDVDTTLAIAHTLAAIYRVLGHYQKAYDLDEDSLHRERRLRGYDHPHTLDSASSVAADLYELGEFEKARELDEDTLARKQRLFGNDHAATLVSATSLAVALSRLGEFEKARELNEDTLARERRLFGDDHPATLISVTNLAINLRQLGEFEAARLLDEEALDRKRRVLGDDHPSTLASANNLAVDLRQLEEFDRARKLDEDTLLRRRRVLGDKHPETRRSVVNLADDLKGLGRHDDARELLRTFPPQDVDPKT